jgi:hypothetical protein
VTVASSAPEPSTMLLLASSASPALPGSAIGRCRAGKRQECQDNLGAPCIAERLGRHIRFGR